MSSYDKTSLWVIFDTCTQQKYYQDVHNLLALPRGAIILYTYRRTQLSDEAMKVASTSSVASLPQQVLLVYGQLSTYKRGDPNPQGVFPSTEMLWVPTRLAEMQLVTKSGEHYYFYLKVSGYPRTDAATQQRILMILEPLIKIHDVPYRKWVAISIEMAALAHISDDNDIDNWQGIVNELSKTPIQFHKDTFWCIKGPYKRDTSRIVKPSYQSQSQVVAGKSNVNSVQSVYKTFEGESYRLEIHSHTAEELSTRPSRTLEIKSDDKGPIRIASEKSLELRRYGPEPIQFSAQRSETVDTQRASLSLQTEQRDNGWPVGPEVSLIFQTRKRLWRVLLAIVFGLVASAATLLIGSAMKILDAAGILKLDVWNIIVASCILAFWLALSVLLTNILYSGKISFKL
jgi:hypothetical protein